MAGRPVSIRHGGRNRFRTRITKSKQETKNDHQQERVMRQTISRMIAAIAVVAPVYSGCNPCGGWAVHERLPDPEVQYGYTSGGPVHQYYYAEQGPTYTG